MYRLWVAARCTEAERRGGLLEYYCVECGGTLLIRVEVREQCQEAKKSRCGYRRLISGDLTNHVMISCVHI